MEKEAGITNISSLSIDNHTMDWCLRGDQISMRFETQMTKTW